MPCGLNAHVHGTAVRPEPRENDIRYDKMMVTTPRSIPVLWYTLSIDHHGSKVTFARLVRTQQCTLHIGMSQSGETVFINPGVLKVRKRALNAGLITLSKCRSARHLSWSHSEAHIKLARRALALGLERRSKFVDHDNAHAAVVKQRVVAFLRVLEHEPELAHRRALRASGAEPVDGVARLDATLGYRSHSGGRSAAPRRERDRRHRRADADTRCRARRPVTRPTAIGKYHSAG